MKPEIYQGLVVVFDKEGDRVIAGFETRPRIVSGHTKAEAFEKMKEIIIDFSPAVLHSYENHRTVMKELEVL